MPGTQPIPDDWTKKWADNQPFEIQTSGSTGDPKPFALLPHLIKWSAEQTRKHFIQSNSLHQLLAIPIEKVGGFMQWARAKTWNTPIDIVKPSANPLLSYSGSAKITSLTPMQIEGILSHPESRKKLLDFESILIGGAPISGEIEERLVRDYPHIHWVHTFGMTETYSHFAGRILGQSTYALIDETEISQNEIGLCLKNPCTENRWMQTHDLVEITASNRFVWTGRSDFTINSGGVKIQLETVELEIQKLTGWSMHDFFCWGEPDAVLGQRLVLYAKMGLHLSDDLQFSSRYYRPKHVYTLDSMVYTATGKISRAESASLSVK
jgi:O-succinylbenzoic acid--CoA ligase